MSTNSTPSVFRMRCIFCNVVSDACVSQEHIVPESLGNTRNKRNNYFAREVEKPFLDSLYGRCSQFEMTVANKKGRIPPATGLHAQWRTKIEIFEIECQGRA